MLLLMLAGMVVLGLLMDLGVVLVQHARLESATEAAAHAALHACATGSQPHGPCAERVAAAYLQANYPGAVLEAILVTAPARVEVRAWATAGPLFGSILGASPLQIRSVGTAARFSRQFSLRVTFPKTTVL